MSPPTPSSAHRRPRLRSRRRTLNSYGYVTNLIQPEKLARADAYAENTNFPDDGCEINPHCLACPLVLCVYDEHQGLAHLKLQRRHEEVKRLRDLGYTPAQIEADTGMSRRSVFRLTHDPSIARLSAIAQVPAKILIMPISRQPEPERTIMSTLTPLDFLRQRRAAYDGEEMAVQAHLDAVVAEAEAQMAKLRRTRDACDLMIEDALDHPLPEPRPAEPRALTGAAAASHAKKAAAELVEA